MIDRFEKYNFTDDQRVAFNSLLSGKNVFLSGNAGTGKTYVINAFIDYLEEEEKNFLCCAPTGISAQNLRYGTTIHRAFKINPSRYDMPINVTKEVNLADVIIVDEISMVSCHLFDQMASELKIYNKKTRHHQLVVVGDFFQLPPVISDKRGKNNEASQLECMKQFYPNIAQTRGYAFTSNSWELFHFNCFNLSKIIRQNEPELIKNLNLARVGDAECIKYFNQRVGKINPIEDATTIKIAGTNNVVDGINGAELKKIDETSHTYTAKIYDPEKQLRKSDKPVEDKITLKKSARVMIVTNAEDIQDYQNGSLGTIIDFNNDGLPVVKFDNGKTFVISKHRFKVNIPIVEDVKKNDMTIQVVKTKTIAEFVQLPLKLAYAITMHKVQGKTFDKIIISDPHCWDAGQLYVALSRVTNIDGLKLLKEIHESDLICSESVKEYYMNFNTNLIENGMTWKDIKCPEHLIPSVQEYIQSLIAQETK